MVSKDLLLKLANPKPGNVDFIPTVCDSSAITLLLCTSSILTKKFKITKDFYTTYALLHQFHAKLFFFQMLRKSVETRDCLSSIEPRNVRAVMKRVIEDVTGIDSLVGQLYEEGVRTERTSDSTRRSYTYSNQRQASRSQWSYAPRYNINVSVYEEHPFQ